MSFKVIISGWHRDGRGQGLHHGRKILVSQAIPGEEVWVNLDTKKPLQGRIQKIEQESTLRVDHPCQHEFACTGCAFLALDPAEESALKKQRLIETLGGLPIEDVLRPSDLFYYRHFAKQIVTQAYGRIVLGSYIQGTHAIADNLGCPVLTPDLSRLLKSVALHAQNIPVHPAGLRYVLARQSAATGEQLLLLSTSNHNPEGERALCRKMVEMHPQLKGAHLLFNKEDSDNLLAGEFRRVAGQETITDTVLNFEHTVSTRSFFQINPQAAQAMFTLALDWVGTGKHCIDGYAGVGVLALPLSERFEKVTAIESSTESIAALKQTQARYGKNNIDVHASPVEAVLAQVIQGADAAIFDPPRKGLGEAVPIIAQSTLKKIALLSCEPQSLKRDLPPLIEAGYKVEKIIPVDQFPRTAHVETVTLLSKGTI
jgi:23S rRNA (uracil1939-C5)-methyltransferase